MAAYIQGNLATQPKREQAQRVKVRETHKVVYRTKSLPTQEKLLYLFTVAVLVVAAGVILWRYAQIYQMNSSIMQIQRDIKAMQAENMALKQTIDKLQSPDRLKEEATKYGMVPSDESIGAQPQTQAQPPASKVGTNTASGSNAKSPQSTKTSTVNGSGSKVAINR